jgi:perosamine synthetase
MACFSFYASKIITTGEGGMVVTNDDKLAERLYYLRNVAFGTPRFVHRDAGFNFRMAGYQAAMGRVQLRKIDAIIDDRRRLARLYNNYLSTVPGVRTPIEENWAHNVYWMYVIVLSDEFPLGRDALMESLRDAGIDSRTHFCPMNLQPFLRRQPGFRTVACPIAEQLWERGMYLPSTGTLDEETIARIAGHIGASADRTRTA